jgi:hypothetical protein
MTPDVTPDKAQVNVELLDTFSTVACKLFSMLLYLQYFAISQFSEPGKFVFSHVANGTEQWIEDIDTSPDTYYMGRQTCNKMASSACK